MKTRLRLKWTLSAILILLIAYLAIDYVFPGKSPRFSSQVAVLEYHHIDPEASDYTITPEAFKEHLIALKSSGYQVISMKQFVDFMNGTGTVPPGAVVITFDDGYESFYQYAYPILKEQGMTASNFLIVSAVGTKTEEGTAFMTWEQIQQMKADGFGFYSHTYNSHDFVPGADGKPVNSLTNPIFLPALNRVETEQEYAQRVKADLVQAEQVLREKLGTQDQLLCLPHGRYDATTLAQSRQAGIQYIFTGVDGLNLPGTTLVKRINGGAAKVTAEKLLDKLTDETRLLGRLKIALKNVVTSYRMGE